LSSYPEPYTLSQGFAKVHALALACDPTTNHLPGVTDPLDCKMIWGWVEEEVALILEEKGPPQRRKRKKKSDSQPGPPAKVSAHHKPSPR